MRFVALALCSVHTVWAALWAIQTGERISGREASVSPGMLLWRCDRKKTGAAIMLGIFAGLCGAGIYEEELDKIPQTLFAAGSALAILHSTRAWLWARKAVRNMREDTVSLVEVRSGTGEGGERTWERYLVYENLHAALDEPGSLVSQEDNDTQDVTILRRGEAEIGKPLMVYFESRWQQTLPASGGGVETVRARARY